MKRVLIIPAACFLLALGASCGAPAASISSRAPSSAAHVDQVRTILTAADELAREYGQDHLGHYLKLSKKVLVRDGLDLPRGISIQIDRDHTSYCLRVTSEALPSIHPWHTASVGSTGSNPTRADRCEA